MYREQSLQDQLRAAKETVQNMQRLHDYGQSQLFEFRTQTEEERAAKQSELNLLTDEVERAQSRLLSLEREKVLIFFLHLWSSSVLCFAWISFWHSSMQDHLRSQLQAAHGQENHMQERSLMFLFLFPNHHPFHILWYFNMWIWEQQVRHQFKQQFGSIADREGENHSRIACWTAYPWKSIISRAWTAYLGA